MLLSAHREKFSVSTAGLGQVLARDDLLVLSQVVLALQLPFAMFPLLNLTGSKRLMGERVNPLALAAAGWASALLITAMDVWGLPGAVADLAAVI